MARTSTAARLIGGLFALAGIAAAGIGLVGAVREAALLWQSDAAPGVVEAVQPEYRRRSLVWVSRIRFATRTSQEIEARARGANSWARQAAGDRVVVRYDPGDPQRASIEPVALAVGQPLLAVPLGGILLALGWAMVGGPAMLRRLLIASGAALAVGLAMTWAANEVLAALAYQRGTALAEGRVVGHATSTRSRAAGGAETLHAALVRFTPEAGPPVTLRLPDLHPEPLPAEGSAVRLRYRRDAPERAWPDSALLDWWRAAASLLLLAAVLGGGATMLWRRSQPRA